MNEKTLRVLEYYKITEMLSGFAISSMAKQLSKELMPSTSYETVSELQKETSDATSCFLRFGALPLGGISDIRPQLKRAEYGGILSISELLKIGELLKVVRKVKKYSKFERERFDTNESKINNEDEEKTVLYESLDNLFSALIQLNEIENEIERCILSETEVSDDASVELRNIRREKKISNDRIKEQLNSIIHSSTYKNMLQDPVVTIRGGRYCVPIKHEYKNSFNGMIHDQSSTGATLFIEPMSIVNLNNKIKELEGRENNEIEKILYKLTNMVSDNYIIISANLENLVLLDFAFAKAAFSVSLKASMPNFNESGIIDIRKARHPLISDDVVVPTNIWLGKDFNTLLITGPNTGGKTVSLKTIGLLTLMGMAGLQIPALDGSTLSVFKNVFADIGDEQSIMQNLSTFSSHMSNIVEIINNVEGNSLVLFDELGAGTDPVEGAALAMAIISYLNDLRIRTVVTTHYSELKVFAIETKGIENASCEFDVETLKPTFRLLIGIPGKSNAFAISKRLGLSEMIINSAKEFVSHESVRFEDVITDLEISQKKVEIEKDRAEQFRKEAERLKKDIEEQKESLRAQRDKIISNAKKEAFDIIKKADDESELTLKNMRKAFSNKVSLAEIENERKKLRDKVQEAYEKADVTHKRKKGVVPTTVNEGDKVFIPSFNQSGVIVSQMDKNGDTMVNTGNMKIKINISQLETFDGKVFDTPNSDNKDELRKTSYKSGVKANKSYTVKTEIDIRGSFPEDAIEKAEKYLDDAYLSGLKQVWVIHGKGTGVLRSAIHDMLSNHPHVTSYRLGKYGEGETGVTVVELK